ncbi:hypothetical protein D3C85_1368570 [compost metagenome]
MQGKVADAAKEIVWKAYQTYKDGSVVEWVGANGSDKPASVTTVKAKTGATTDSHGNVTAAAGSAGDSESNTSLYLSIAAVVLGAAALLVSLLRKRA